MTEHPDAITLDFDERLLLAWEMVNVSVENTGKFSQETLLCAAACWTTDLVNLDLAVTEHPPTPDWVALVVDLAAIVKAGGNAS